MHIIIKSIKMNKVPCNPKPRTIFFLFLNPIVNNVIVLFGFRSSIIEHVSCQILSLSPFLCIDIFVRYSVFSFPLSLSIHININSVMVHLSLWSCIHYLLFKGDRYMAEILSIRRYTLSNQSIIWNAGNK